MKTACISQCAQCPFRPTSLPSYLGDYTVTSVMDAIWHNQPFFCHTKIDYSRGRAMEQAHTNGKLCRGSIAFADKLGVPLSGGDPQVVTARLVNQRHESVECMSPAQFADWHNPDNMTNLGKLPKIAKGSSKGTKSRVEKGGKPTDAEVEAEIAALKAIRPLIVPHSMFGDDNLAMLDAQITALEERMDESDVSNQWGLLDEDDEDDGLSNADLNEQDGRSDNKESSAMEAAQWLNGDRLESLAEGWPLTNP